eukprot:symbB.v1.2.026857.t1/scaffold2717.1/size72376/1
MGCGASMPVMPLVEGDEIPRIGKGMAAVRKGQVAPVQDFSGVLDQLLLDEMRGLVSSQFCSETDTDTDLPRTRPTPSSLLSVSVAKEEYLERLHGFRVLVKRVPKLLSDEVKHRRREQFGPH